LRLRSDRPGTPLEQAQSRLLRAALVPAMLTALLWLAAAALSRSNGALAVHAEDWMRALQGAVPPGFAVGPVPLLVGFLRYRLFPIDTIASRTLLSGLLAGFVTVAYVLAVWLTGALVGSGAWAAVLAMTLVALAVEPVRAALHRLANRLVFG